MDFRLFRLSGDGTLPFKTFSKPFIDDSSSFFDVSTLELNSLNFPEITMK